MSFMIPDTLQDFAQNAGKYGVPTFEEVDRPYYNKRDQMFGREDDEVTAIDKGDPMLGCTQSYYIQDVGSRYRLESLEQAERIAQDMGLSLHRDFVVDPQLRNNHRGSFYNEVTFRSKRSGERRKRWA